jgi:hypothetical protein
LIQPQNQTQQRGNDVLKSLPFTDNPALVTTSLKQGEKDFSILPWLQGKTSYTPFFPQNCFPLLN